MHVYNRRAMGGDWELVLLLVAGPGKTRRSILRNETPVQYLKSECNDWVSLGIDHPFVIHAIDTDIFLYQSTGLLDARPPRAPMARARLNDGAGLAGPAHLADSIEAVVQRSFPDHCLSSITYRAGGALIWLLKDRPDEPLILGHRFAAAA